MASVNPNDFQHCFRGTERSALFQNGYKASNSYYLLQNTTKIAVRWSALLFHIRKVPRSNHSPEQEFPDFLQYILFLTKASLHILSSSSIAQ